MRRLLLVMTLGTMLFGSAHAEGDPTPEASGFSVLGGSTITCSTAWPSATFACWWERPILTLGDVEVSISLDAQLAVGGVGDSYLAPMLSVAWYGPVASAWIEVALPADWLPVAHVGRGDWLRLGASYRIP